MAKRIKKNRITLLLLIGALVLLSGFYIWYMNKDRLARDDKGEANKNVDSNPIIATMESELIDKIHFKGSDIDITLILEGDTWVSEADKMRPIRQHYVQNMIYLVGEVKAIRVVDESPEELGQYGLGSPYAYIEASQSDGKSVALTIGNKIASGQGYYGKLEGDDIIYLLPPVYGTSLSYSDVNMTHIEHGPTIDANDVFHIEILKKDGEDFEMIYDPESVYVDSNIPLFAWAIIKPYEVAYEADGSKVSDILSNFTNMRFKDCIEYRAEDFNKYGLDDPKASIFIEYYHHQPGEDSTERSFKLFVGEQDDEGDYYVRKDGDEAVYTMATSIVDSMVDIDAFSILHSFIGLHNIGDVDKIHIDIRGTSYTMDIQRESIINDDGEEETLVTYYYNGERTEEIEFKNLYQTIIAAKMDAQLKEEGSIEDSELILTTSYYLTGVEEPRTTKYYSYDDVFYLIDNGYPIRFVADKRRIDRIINAIEEFEPTAE